MLKIYKALSYQGMISCSKNSPWLVLVNADGVVKPYIIKLFDRHGHYEGDKMARELMGNLLAAEFGLDVPDCALIDISDLSFGPWFSNQKALGRFQQLKIKIALGTQYLFPHLCFFPGSLRSDVVGKNFKPAAVFAFDMLIGNRDRNWRRPNLLIHSGITYLIDFESGFKFNKDSLEDMLTRARIRSHYYMHVFYSLLSGLSADEKSTVFGDFVNKLEQTDFSFLDSYLVQLENLGFILRDYQQVKSYFAGIKENRKQFGKVLNSLLDG
jgi:hypothetical protein